MEQQDVSCFQTHILQKTILHFFCQNFLFFIMQNCVLFLSPSWFRWPNSFPLPCKICPFIFNQTWWSLVETSLIHWIPWYSVHLVPWILCFYGSFEDDSSLLPQTASASKQIYNFCFPLQCVCFVHLITANLSLFIFISFQSSCTFIFYFFFILGDTRSNFPYPW